MDQPTTRTIRTGDIDMHLEERGSGEPLLLLHGLTGSCADFAHLFDLDALAADRRVLAPDARSHGRSETSRANFTVSQCARDVLALLDALAIDRVCAVGVSLGALTLLHVAIEAPERVRRMVLVSATTHFPEPARAIMRHAGELAAELAAGAEDADVRGRLASVAAEVLVVAGDRDPLYPVELAVDLYRGIPRASLYVVPGGGHSPVFLGEQPAFASRALAFLRSA